MPFPVSPNPGDSYTDAYGTVWIYAGSVNGWYRQTVIPGNETSYTADLITTDKIIDNTIINADVASNAAIAGTKISPNFGSQNVTTTGTSTAASFIPTSSTAPTNGLYLSAANSVALSTNATERLRITSAGLVGIGTATPTAKLSVVGAAVASTDESISASASGAYGHSFSAGNNFLSYFSKDNNGVFRLGRSSSSIGGGSVTGLGTGGLAFSTSTDNSSYTERARIDSSGRLLVGTSTDSGGSKLQINDNRIRIATAKTPASATDTGVTGEICWDANYVYVCTATNTWKRTALATW